MGYLQAVPDRAVCYYCSQFDINPALFSLPILFIILINQKQWFICLSVSHFSRCESKNLKASI